MKTVIILFLIFSVLSVILTVYDKLAAKTHKYRIPEKVLIFTAFMGGAAAQYLTMKLIHHKTRHKKFMLGLPLIIIIHAAIIYIFFYFKI